MPASPGEIIRSLEQHRITSLPTLATMEKMWKKLPRYHRPSGRYISGPTLVQTTFDEETLSSIPRVSQAQVTPTSVPSARDRSGPQPLEELRQEPG